MPYKNVVTRLFPNERKIMPFRKSFSTFLFFFTALLSAAQSLEPVTRFFPSKGKYDFYDDSFMSGFLQSATLPQGGNARHDGFLQMPFTGDPLLVYVGEKDSTQFMAYASAYEMPASAASGDTLRVRLTRYGVQAALVSRPAYVEHTYTFPDTTAAKGFLIDIDHAMSGAGNEDMDVVFVDKQNIRAYKRSRSEAAGSPQLYYFAHFSAPFKTWNVRRERVTLENGQKEARCKVAFTFDLQPGEQLIVQSAVSAISTDEAFSQLPTKLATRHFDDTRRPAPVNRDAQLLAQARREEKANAASRGNAPAKRKNTSSKKKFSSSEKKNSSAQTSKTERSVAASTSDALFEVKTRDARLKTAFYSALSQLRERRELKKTATAADFLQKIAPLYAVPSATAADEVSLSDSLLARYAENVFKGEGTTQGFENCADPKTTAAAWYVFTSLGLRPAASGDAYELAAPAFNVASLQMQAGRRLVIYVRRADKNRRRVASATLSGTALEKPYTLSHDQLLHGGMLEVKMTE